MVRNFWILTACGGYATHGEVIEHENFRGGGELLGTSPERIAFLRNILADSPSAGLEPLPDDPRGARKGEAYFLYYFADETHGEQTFALPGGKSYQVDLIDTWNMTITPLAGEHSGTVELVLPDRPYMAVRMRTVETGHKSKAKGEKK